MAFLRASLTVHYNILLIIKKKNTNTLSPTYKLEYSSCHASYGHYIYCSPINKNVTNRKQIK